MHWLLTVTMIFLTALVLVNTSEESEAKHLNSAEAPTLDSLVDDAKFNSVFEDETFGQNSQHKPLFNRRSSKSQSRGMLYPHWPEVEAGNVLDIDWDPHPPKRGGLTCC
ncbi:unnamed protein product [Dicrocoelium dendriticum]|nr:unnamed protein product [Dicrocoelium dendriticum]